jgi:hypothetical protein
MGIRLLLRNSLKTTVNVPTRITKFTLTLLNDIVMKVKNSLEPSVIMDLGLSLHYVQVLTIALKLLSNVTKN